MIPSGVVKFLSTYALLLAMILVGVAVFLAVIAYTPSFITTIKSLIDDPSLIRELRQDITVGLFVNVAYALIAYVAGVATTLIFARRRFDIRINIIVTRMSRNMEAVLLDRTLNPLVAAKKIVLLRDDGLKRIDHISHSLNSDLETLASLIRDADERRAVNKRIPPHLTRRIEELIGVLRDTWPERKSRLEASVEELMYYFGEARPNDSAGERASE